MYQFCFYVPKSYLIQVKSAVFEAGGGKIGNYDQCCFEIQGQGQFRPLSGSHSYIGNLNQLELVEEVKVEMMVEKELKSPVLAAFLRAHPYETPAFFFIETIS